MKQLVALKLLCLFAAGLPLGSLPANAADQEIVKRGKAAYDKHCLHCHGPNPSKKGPMGPEIAGASRELLETKLLKGTYPPGYKPKHPTNIMVKMPQVKDDIPALVEYLKQAN